MSNYNLKKNVEQYSTSKEIAYDGVEVYGGENNTLIGSAPINTVLNNPLVVSFPWNKTINGVNEGQIVAENIWNEIEGTTYNPYSAQNAITHPAVELGEPIVIDGLYTLIANRDIKLDLLYTEDIAAPQKEEIEEEYQAPSAYDKLDASIRVVSKAAASLKVDIASITAEILDIDGVLATSLTIDSNGFIFYNNGNSVTISGGNIQANTIVASKLDLHGDIDIFDAYFNVKKTDPQTQVATTMGYIGYGTGYDGVSGQYGTATDGIIMSYGDRTNLGTGDYYFIATNAGVRMQGGNCALWVNSNGAFFNTNGHAQESIPLGTAVFL